MELAPEMVLALAPEMALALESAPELELAPALELVAAMASALEMEWVLEKDLAPALVPEMASVLEMELVPATASALEMELVLEMESATVLERDLPLSCKAGRNLYPCRFCFSQICNPSLAHSWKDTLNLCGNPRCPNDNRICPNNSHALLSVCHTKHHHAQAWAVDRTLQELHTAHRNVCNLIPMTRLAHW